MSVWLTIPSKRPPEEAEKVLNLWRERGYKIALWRDPGEWRGINADLILDYIDYPGYAEAVNQLIRDVLRAVDPSAEWFIAAGDDVEPDLNHSAEEIAVQCREHFAAALPVHPGQWTEHGAQTFGVMQPTGDRWGDKGDGKGAYIDRVCGSAWIGREFARRINQGNGPLWPEYFHMFVDEHLQCVAQKLGVLWQRRDLIQLHKHWGRGPDAHPNQIQNPSERMPDFLKRANSAEEWQRGKAIFQKHKEAGFAESLILAP